MPLDIRKFFGVLATGCSISGVGIGTLLAGWHPKIGIALTVVGYLDLLYELLTCKTMTNRVPEGMLRLLAGTMLIGFTVLVAKPDIESTLESYRVEKQSTGSRRLDAGFPPITHGLQPQTPPQRTLSTVRTRALPPLAAPSLATSRFRHGSARAESLPCMKDLDTCSDAVIIERVLEMADGIDQLYSEQRRNVHIAGEQAEKATTDGEKESVRSVFEARTDLVLNQYRNKYRVPAQEYRHQLEERIGPSVHDEKMMKLYDISDTRTVQRGSRVIFLSNAQIVDIAWIASDLRETAKKLHLRAVRRPTQ